MNSAKAVQSILQIARYPEQEQHLFISHLITKTFSKKDLILKEGQTCRSIYFVNEGALRHCQNADNGDEITCNLFMENDWVLDMESFVSQKPSKGFIECYSDTELLELSVHGLHSLIAVSQNFLALGSLMNICIRDIKYDTLPSPEEKYNHLISTRPQLLQHFSLKHIASFLRITPETLSRVRRKIMQP
jgi:CRP-like cAMP-binding protein